jgi:tRNA-guanine family transglycosylase
LTTHNLHFLLALVRDLRQAILDGKAREFGAAYLQAAAAPAAI